MQPSPATRDAVDALADRVRRAAAARTPLRIVGGGTKGSLGGVVDGDAEPLDLRAVDAPAAHEPTELVVTAAAGMRLDALEALLAAHRQRLAFEPPRLAPGGTVGGMVASGLSGPSRANAGSLRDHLLGATVVDGNGQTLRFGGRVIKNVAGYDVARVMAGAWGTLGVLVEVSLKVLPMPEATATLRLPLAAGDASKRLHAWCATPLPIDASAWTDGVLLLRLTGAAVAVERAAATLGGERLADADGVACWQGLRDRSAPFFAAARRAAEAGAQRLWRLGMPQTAPALDLAGATLVEWHGAQRWLASDVPVEAVHAAARAAGGHAAIVLGARVDERVDDEPPTGTRAIHARLKRAFDPHGILNPGLGVGPGAGS